MSSTATQIFRWREQIKADRRRLFPIDFLVGYQLSEKTNAREFGKSGCLTTWQGMASIAAAIGVCERTVRRSVRRLQKHKHLGVNPGGGRYHSNRYTLLLRPAVQAVEAANDKAETRTRVSAFPRNPDTDDRVCPITRTPVSLNPDTRVQKPGHRCPPNPSIIESFPNPSADPTPTATPSQAALAAPLKALGPLGDREAELRSILAERFKVLTMGEVIELTGDGELVIATLTPGIGGLIRRDCEADLLAVTGANQLKIVVRLPTEALSLRRMQ